MLRRITIYQLISLKSNTVTEGLCSAAVAVGSGLLPRHFDHPARHAHQLRQSNELRTGNIISHDGRLMEVVKYQHTQGAGRQVGNVQLELRDVLTKAKHPLRLRPSEMIPVVRLEERTYQFLYTEGATAHAMDARTFDQVALDLGLMGAQAPYLHEGVAVTVHSHEGRPVMATLPPTVTLSVVDAAPHTRGNTAQPSFKRATLEGGAAVAVSPFVEKGDQVVVDTGTGEFVKRA